MYAFRRVLKTLLVGFLLSNFLSSTALAGKFTPKSWDSVRTIKNFFCVRDDADTKWFPAKQKGELYKRLKKPKSTAKNYSSKLAKFKKRKKKCKKQSAPNAQTLASLPSGGDFITEVTSQEVVTGTPPAFTDITNTSALSLYWRDVDSENVIAGLVSGTPTANQCDEFFAGGSDGESGGLLACQANIDAVRALVKPLEASIAACYLRNLATQSTVDDGGVSLTSPSSFPGANIENLYAAPNGSSDRVVRMDIVNDDFPQSIFVKIYAAQNNEANDRSYQVDLWFCDDTNSGTSPSGVDQIYVGTDNSFSATSTSAYDDSLSMVLTGMVTQDDDGDYDFDPESPSQAAINFVTSDQSNKFAYSISVEDGRITMKKNEVNTGSNSSEQGYALIDYLGDVDDLAMSQGGLKFRSLVNDTPVLADSAAFEYRTTTYASAPGNELHGLVQAFEFSSDTFYSTAPSVSLDTTGYACDATASYVIEVDMASTSMQAIETACNAFVPQNTDFCASDDITDAEDSFENNC